MNPRDLVASMPFSEQVGVVIDEASPTAVSGRLDWSPERCTIGGVMHGGALMSLADSLGAVCAFLNLPEGAQTSTIESKTNLMRAVREGTVTARSTPLHVGRRVIVVQTETRDAQHRLVALTIQTQAVISPS
jgi:uncharacterized protein (TIGR00369 family)